MSARRPAFACTACGATFAKWAGRCDACGAWNSIVEEPASTGRAQAGGRRIPLGDLATSEPPLPRAASGILELDRVLGGGLVPASAVLVGGDPGIGKSTLLLQAAAAFAAQGTPAVYVSGEEAAAQVRMRAARLGLAQAPLRLATGTGLGDILATLEAERPALAVVELDPDPVVRPHRQRPRLGRPGPRLRPRARRLRQAPRHRDRPRRPRHQGRPDRRPARRRAHGRHRALLRGRARPPVPHPARGQEPLRPGRRDRRLRDDRRRPRRGGEPLGALSLRARHPRLRLRRLRRRRGHKANPRRDPGPRRPRRPRQRPAHRRRLGPGPPRHAPRRPRLPRRHLVRRLRRLPQRRRRPAHHRAGRRPRRRRRPRLRPPGRRPPPRRGLLRRDQPLRRPAPDRPGRRPAARGRQARLRIRPRTVAPGHRR